jgi:hypothetical protein
MALHAYCEAFLDFKRGMSRLLVARGSDETSSDLQEFAGIVARAVRLETGSTASKLAQLLRYLLLLHQHQNHSHFHPCWWPSVTSQTQQLCAQLLLPGRDAMPPEALEPRRCASAVLRVREEDVQVCRQAGAASSHACRGWQLVATAHGSWCNQCRVWRRRSMREGQERGGAAACRSQACPALSQTCQCARSEC